MRNPPRILAVDDVAENLEILQMRLESRGYEVVLAADGEAALAAVREQLPDLILLDIMMPKMDGIEVARRLKADTSLPFIPIILVTAKADDKDVVAGLDAGGDDYLTKPFEHAALVARVRSMLRIKELHDEVRRQAAQLADWNAKLEERIATQLAEIERIGRLKRFLAPQIAEMIVSAGSEQILDSHRRDIIVLFCDLRGFTAFAETAEPEEVMALLADYHGALGPLVHHFEGTLDRFSGDGMMVFFNDPLPCPDPAERAVRLGIAMREAFAHLAERWQRRGQRNRPWRRHRSGICDDGTDRLRGPLRIQRHRHGLKSRSTVMCRGEGWADSAEPARGDRGRRTGATDTGGRAFAQGFDAARTCLQCCELNGIVYSPR